MVEELRQLEMFPQIDHDLDHLDNLDPNLNDTMVVQFPRCNGRAPSVSQKCFHRSDR